VVNKWNGREFAARHGCHVPALLWAGGSLARPPLDSLPDHFVIRPVRGLGRRGVRAVSDGFDLLAHERADPAALAKRLSPLRRIRGPVPLLVEEFVTTEEGEHRLPVELKCHTFGPHVAAVELLERTGVNADSRRYYTPAWEPFKDLMHVALARAEVRDPPRGLEAMLARASALGAAFGTYMRIDFFASELGCVFNEFSSVPLLGRDYTPYCNELFGALWAEHHPNAV
jgi:hypothetical protein